MALRKPLVVIGGQIQELPAVDTITTGTPIDAGIRYNLPAVTSLVVPVDFQYLIKGRLSVALGSSILAQGQVVVI